MISILFFNVRRRRNADQMSIIEMRNYAKQYSDTRSNGQTSLDILSHNPSNLCSFQYATLSRWREIKYKHTQTPQPSIPSSDLSRGSASSRHRHLLQKPRQAHIPLPSLRIQLLAHPDSLRMQLSQHHPTILEAPRLLHIPDRILLDLHICRLLLQDIHQL